MDRLLQPPTLARVRHRFSRSHCQIEHFHEQRECHGEIGVPLWNMKAQAFGDEVDADKKEKTQREHFNGGMPSDEAAYGTSENHHHNYRQNDRDNHHRDFIDHSDRGDHRIDREHEIEQSNLHENGEH